MRELARLLERPGAAVRRITNTTGTELIRRQEGSFKHKEGATRQPASSAIKDVQWPQGRALAGEVQVSGHIRGHPAERNFGEQCISSNGSPALLPLLCRNLVSASPKV